MILSIIIAIVSGILFAIIQISISNNKQKKLDKSWESCNCTIDRAIKHVEHENNKKNDYLYQLLEKYNKGAMKDDNTYYKVNLSLSDYEEKSDKYAMYY
jgi:hypothetical protein